MSKLNPFNRDNYSSINTLATAILAICAIVTLFYYIHDHIKNTPEKTQNNVQNNIQNNVQNNVQNDTQANPDTKIKLNSLYKAINNLNCEPIEKELLKAAAQTGKFDQVYTISKHCNNKDPKAKATLNILSGTYNNDPSEVLGAFNAFESKDELGAYMEKLNINKRDIEACLELYDTIAPITRTIIDPTTNLAIKHSSDKTLRGKRSPVFPSTSKSEFKYLNPDRKDLEDNIKSAMPFYPHRANTIDNKVLAHDKFESAELCGGCHQEIYRQWKSSMMAQSWEDPIYRAILKRASEDTNGKMDNFCAGCHTPIGLTTGLIDSKVNRMTPKESMKTRPMPGIDCDGCHNMVARTGLDNGAYVLNPKANNGKPTKWGPRKDAVSPYHDSEYSELHTRSDFCGVCHNETHPFNGVPSSRTYDEWLESPYAENNQVCQDCHMKPFKGTSAIGGKERDDIASHWFSGANSTMISHFGDAKGAERARNMLRSAGELEFTHLPENLTQGQLAKVSVKVHNKGAGHKLPTGFPAGREVWLDFKVKDANGKEIYRLGAIKNGKTEPGTENFKAYMGDKNGKEVDLEVWNITHIILDKRILPGGYSIRDFEFVVPQNAIGPLTITAELRYWPFPQYLVDFLLGKGTMTVDIVTIDTKSATINVSQTLAMIDTQ